MIHTLSTLALTVVVVLAVASDVRTRRIPNVLTVSGLGVALALRAITGVDAFVAGLAGGAIALGLTLPLVMLGGLGGGDSKLLVAVGAFLGPAGLPMALLVTALVGGVMALGLVAYRGVLGATLAHCWQLIRRLWTPSTPEPLRTLGTPGAIAIPYGVAIGAGAIAGWIL
jgi:prepilin peptidase CpaA